MEPNAPEGSEPQSSEEHTAGWQRHWDRRRPYVALVVAEYDSGERAALCTYCLDRRSEPHPRCQAPGCTCRWHTREDGKADPTPITGAPKSVGLVWKTVKPWKHPRMLRSVLVRVQLRSQEGRFRRRKVHQRKGFFWMKRPEKRPDAGKPSGGALRAVPPIVEAAADAPAEATSMVAAPGQRGRGSSLAIGAALALLVVLRVPHERTPLQPCNEVSGTAIDGGLGMVLQTVLRAPTIIKGPAVPSQARPPCRKNLVELEGACWREFRVEVKEGEGIKELCTQQMEFFQFVISTEDCIKNRRFFLASIPRPTPNSVDPQAEKKP